MNTDQMYQDSRTISLVSGVAVPDFTIPPGTLQAFIAYVDIDNTESAVPVQLIIGERSVSAVGGTPNIKTIAAYTRQSYNINPERYCCLHWPNTPTNSCAVQVQWQDKFQSALVGLASVVSSFSSDYPLGSTPFSINALSETLSGTNPGFSVPFLPIMQVGQKLYVTTLFVQGVEYQRLSFSVQILDANNQPLIGTLAFANGKDINLTFIPPIVSGQGATLAGRMQCNFAIGPTVSETVQGVIWIDMLIGGYFL